jgi:hypothetical protein
MPSAQRRLISEALVELTKARAGLRLRPFRSVVKAASRPLGKANDGSCPRDIVRSVESAARRLPWTPVCFDLGLAVQHMLRRRGQDSILHYGIAPKPPSLAAHVWVSLDGDILIGGEEAAAMREVAQYPAKR